MNTEGVVADVSKLKGGSFANKAVAFIAFPVVHENPDWQVQLRRISSSLAKLSYVPFAFAGGVPGVLYFGLV
jgi:hypothetical protein